MPCTICGEAGHNATTCHNSVIPLSADLLVRATLDIANEAYSERWGDYNRFFKRIVKRCIFTTTSDWNLGLFKRVDNRFISALNNYPTEDVLERSLQIQCIEAVTRHRRLSIQENITNPRTLASFRKKYISILCFIGRHLTDHRYNEPDLIDPSNNGAQVENVQADNNTSVQRTPIPEVVEINAQLAPLLAPLASLGESVPITPPTPTWRRAQIQETPPPAPRRRRMRDVPRHKPNVPFHMDDNDASYIHDDACAICMESIDDKNIIALQCKHAYCANCVAEFVNRCNGKCPSCRENIQKICFKPSILPDNFNKMISILNNNS